MVLPGSGAIKGKKAIADAYAGWLKDDKVTDASLMDTHYASAGKVSTGWGAWKLTTVPKAGGEPTTEIGTFCAVAAGEGRLLEVRLRPRVGRILRLLRPRRSRPYSIASPLRAFARCGAAPSGHVSAPRACDASLPSAAKNIVSFGRFELSFVVVSPEGSRTSVPGNGGTRFFSFSHASSVAKSLSCAMRTNSTSRVVLQRLLLEKDPGELVGRAGRRRREEVQDERVSRLADEVAASSRPASRRRAGPPRRGSGSRGRGRDAWPA